MKILHRFTVLTAVCCLSSASAEVLDADTGMVHLTVSMVSPGVVLCLTSGADNATIE